MPAVSRTIEEFEFGDSLFTIDVEVEFTASHRFAKTWESPADGGEIELGDATVTSVYDEEGCEVDPAIEAQVEAEFDRQYRAGRWDDRFEEAA